MKYKGYGVRKNNIDKRSTNWLHVIIICCKKLLLVVLFLHAFQSTFFIIYIVSKVYIMDPYNIFWYVILVPSPTHIIPSLQNTIVTLFTWWAGCVGFRSNTSFTCLMLHFLLPLKHVMRSTWLLYYLPLLLVEANVTQFLSDRCWQLIYTNIYISKLWKNQYL